MSMPIFKVEDLQYLQIGMQGENDAVRIGIDMSSWVDELADRYPNPHFHLLYKPQGQNRALPMVTSYDPETKILTWEVTLSATYIEGVGYTEARALNLPDNGLLKKSRVIPTLVEESVTGIEGGTVPAPYEDWVNYVLSVKDELNNILGNPDVAYHNSSSGTIAPDDNNWTSSPDPEKGSYMWTRITYNWTTGSPGTVYTVTYIGMDGEGVVTAVNGIDGNVVLDGKNVMVDVLAESPEPLKNAVRRLESADTAIRETILSDQLRMDSMDTEIAAKLDADSIVYSASQPDNPTPGMIWLKPKV